MKKALLLFLSIILLQIPALSANKKMIPTSSNDRDLLPNIFIYTIPDDTEEIKEDIPAPVEEISEKKSEDEILLEYEDITLGATTLKGYAQYVEDSSVVHLKDDNDNYVLNIKNPQKISSNNSLNIAQDYKKPKITTTYINPEYIIAPNSIKSTGKIGDVTFGALYGSEVSGIAMLEIETGLFTKYEKSRFALSSSVKKSLNTTYGLDYNTVSIAPELKLNNYMSLKNVLSSDVTRRRNSSELVFSLNPFGSKDKDRLLFEVGAKQTTYVDTGFQKTQFKFSTQFKL